MIENTASSIVDLLIRYGVIEIEQAPIYQYGFEIMLSTLITCSITIVAGLLLHCLLAACIFFLLFVLLRSVCGGYHAKSYLHCNLIFAFVTAGVLLCYKFIPLAEFTVLHYCILLLSIVITCVYAPVENENKPLSQKQKKYGRFLSVALMVLLALLSSLLEIKILSSYSILIDATMLVVSVSMFVTEPSRGGDKKCTK